MNTDERERHLTEIRKRHNQQPPSTATITEWRDIDFLLSLLDSQAAEATGEALAEQIVNRCLCAEPAHDCEESAALHVRNLVQAIAALPKSQWDALCEQHHNDFNVFHVGGCLACWNASERESATTTMRTACVEKVRAMRDRFQAAADASSLPNDLTASRDTAVATALTRLLGELESLPLEQGENDNV